MKNFIFIIGVGRSGTSLLQAMFAANKSITYLPETSFLRRFISTNKCHSTNSKYGSQKVISTLEKDEQFIRINKNISEVVESSLKRNEKSLDLAIYKTLLEEFSIDAEWVGDKDPRAIEYLSVIHSIAPCAHIIHIIRDPRDILASKKKAAWSMYGHVWKHIFANKVQMKIGRILGPRLFKENYHEASYEKLISEPELVLKSLCREVGVSYDSSMLEFGTAAKNLVSKSEMRWKKETLGPLLASNKDKWKKTLTDKEIRLVELCCSDTFISEGYVSESRNKKFSILDSLWVWSGYLVINLCTFPYINYRRLTGYLTCRRLK